MNRGRTWHARVLRGLSGRLERHSLRTLLGAAALAALVTAAALGTLLLLTASAARDVAGNARRIHDRVQAYSLLISSLRNFQNASYADAQLDTPQSRAELQATRDRYREARDAALALPPATEFRHALAQELRPRTAAIEEHLGRTREIVAHIDSVWRTLGNRAAGIEAQRAAQPVREFVSLLDEEIRRGDEAIAASTHRAVSLGRLVVIACIVCLCLAGASWAIIQVLLLGRIGPGLRRLEEGTRAFAAGDMDHRVRLEGQDELARLSAAFDSMADLLAEKQRVVQQVQAGLERAVALRTAELERANRELSASDGRRRAFLADIGHELRTPLTIIRGEAEVALRTLHEEGSDPTDSLVRIIEHTHDLGRMVEDLFLIARAEAGGLPMHVRRVDLRELCRRVAEDFEPLAADRDASIAASRGEPVWWDVDPDRLRRALTALVDNALRHTREGVRVWIDARNTSDGAEITVADDGPGIDPRLVNDLFQRFRRGHTRAEGSGLGLSLVRALVEAQGGRTRLENRTGGGACAVMEFRGTLKLEEGEEEHEPALG